MKGGLNNDAGIGVLVDNYIALHLAGPDISNLLPDLLEESMRLRQRAGIKRRADR